VAALFSESILAQIDSPHAVTLTPNAFSRLAAARNTAALITGPTGSGKEMVARAIHRLSPRGGNTFSVLNCAALQETLIESELFGYLPSTGDSPLVQCLRFEMRDLLARAIFRPA
jgi:transcriptional regulator with PAS, ATPase and Fis domain